MIIDETMIKNIIKRFTAESIEDPGADRDALEAVTAFILNGSYPGDKDAASKCIDSWRREAITKRLSKQAHG